MNSAARLKPRHKAISRDRVLSTAELPVVWRTMGDHGYVSSGFDLLPSLKDLGFWDHQSAADWVGLTPSPPAEEAPSA